VQSAYGSIERLLAAVSEHDDYTGGHSCRVASLSVLLARLMGMDDGAVDVVQQAGLIHDIGKVAMPPDVLTKAGRLTDQEFKMIQLHTTLGASILAAVGGLDHLLPIVLHHHERWDGRGYPTGLSGVDIPIESRIILVADAYDAMTTERPYGGPQSSYEAIEEIERCAGTQFDSLVTEAMRLAYDGGLIEETGAPVFGRIAQNGNRANVLGGARGSDVHSHV
jgi:putative nucleotidyltransferase with HDIG domain